MFLYDNNLDDYGHYLVNNVPYRNKIEAILAADRAGTQPTFIFNDDIYGKYDWTIEPEETLEELYATRAREIRAKYDWIVLHYSGGLDSNNILEIFARHHIHLDEVLLRGPISNIDKNVNNLSASNMYAEVLLAALPIAEHVKDTVMPNLVITVKDTSEYIINFFDSFDNTEMLFNPALGGGLYLSPHAAAYANCDEIDPRYKQLSEQGKKVCHLIGIDKPGLYVENNEYKIRFIDKLVNVLLPPRSSNSDLPLYREGFYWGPTTAPIVIKQGHVLKRYMIENNIPASIVNTTVKTREYHEFIGSIIYNRQYASKFNPEKMTEIKVVNPWDKFFFKDPQARHVLNWRSNMENLDKLVPAKWKHDETLYKTLKGFFTRSYSLET